MRWSWDRNLRNLRRGFLSSGSARTSSLGRDFLVFGTGGGEVLRLRGLPLLSAERLSLGCGFPSEVVESLSWEYSE